MDHLTLFTIIESLPFAVVATDPDLRILAVNHPGRALLGGDLVSGADSDLLSHVPSGDRDRFSATVSALRNIDPTSHPSPSITFPITRSTPQGDRTFHVTATTMRHGETTLAGYLFSSRDLGAVSDESRSHEQESARMEVARQLAATMNHEINNPLFVVSATLEDLLAEIDDPAEQRRLNAALDSVWRVSSAVKKLSEIRQLVTTAYIDGFPMIDLEASGHHPGE